MEPEDTRFNAELNERGIDSLEEAHLAFIRSDHARARSQIKIVLAAEPGNADAKELLDKIEEAEVEAMAEQQRASSSWLDAYDPGTTKLIFIGIGAVLCIFIGIVMGIDPILMGLKKGFSTEVAVNEVNHGWSIPSGVGHYPIHILLAVTLILIGIGSYLLYSVYRYVKGNWG